MRWWSFAVLFLTAASVGAAAPSPDYARETRWADEILPSLMVGAPVYLATPGRAKVLALLTPAVGTEKARVILVHGLGVHPDFGMIGALRGLLADAGYTTLSVQMPVLPADAPRDDYATVLPDAAERLDAAVAFLRGRGPGKVIVVSHSMGATMTDAWRGLAQPAIDGWVPVGMLVPFSAPPRMPVLDVIAEHDFRQVLDAAPARKARLPADRCSAQATIAGADHYFGRYEQPLAVAIEAFLGRMAKGC
ncbi:MAG: alpha/beta fold hydrolase [Casimicrobiaceae bacterium]